MIAYISKDLFHAAESFFSASPYKFQEYSFRYEENLKEFDLATLTREQLIALESVASSNSRVKGSKSLARDIRAWVESNVNATSMDKTRAKNCRQAVKLLIELVRKTPNKHLYTRVTEGVEGVSLAYYVTGISYHKRVEDKVTYEWITIDIAYELFGAERTASFDLHPMGILGLTAGEMLDREGYYVETDELRKDHLETIEKYFSVFDKVGMQMLATGIADDSGVDGNESHGSDSWWRSTRSSQLRLDKDGLPAKVVIDVFHESERQAVRSNGNRRGNRRITSSFWRHQTNITYDKESGEAALLEIDDGIQESDLDDVQIPIHPYVVCFDLKRHLRLKIHVGNLEPYLYDKTIGEKLILPESSSALISVLLDKSHTEFHDIIAGKSGGTIILCQGPPGTGKTLTAEVYAEQLCRPLYTVQCSQLGIDSEGLEDELLKVLARGRRWNAVMLLDEADVYIHARGTDLVQNAIVGVFLRVLEYQSGVLFMTTNRGDLVDDAILSRCTARITYTTPSMASQEKIWSMLAAENNLPISASTVTQIVKANSGLSGRDIKNLMKLAATVARHAKTDITPETIAKIKMFKPTCDAALQARQPLLETK